MAYYRPPIYKTQEELFNKIEEFKVLYNAGTEKKPSKARLDVHLGITGSTRRDWKVDGHKNKELIDGIEAWIKAETTDLAYEGVKHAEYQLGRAFHMSETQKIEQTTKNIHLEKNIDEMDAQEATKLIQDLL